MRTIGTIGEFTLYEDGNWIGMMDENGKILIPSDMRFRSIYEFNQGIAVACRCMDDSMNLTWGLIDTEGRPISEFKYSFIEPWGEGFYKCEMGTKKNILRRDGTEVLKDWFNNVGKVRKGVFTIGITIHKTKEHPTLYRQGLASVQGDILFPPVFDFVRWDNEVLLRHLLAEKDGKPYLLSEYGTIVDPTGDHLPNNGESVYFEWKGPKHTVCHGCVFTDGINEKGEGCRKLGKEEFRNNVIKGECKHYKQDEESKSLQESLDEHREKKEHERALKQTDEFAANVVKAFVRDKLNGDFDRLMTFDFGELRNDTKYGDCGGFAFAPEKTNIMKAIMALVFKDAWPEISYDGFDRYGYEAFMINTYRMLLGFPLGDNFKGLREFRPSAELLDRAWAFHHLSQTIGNFMVMPGGSALARERVRRDQRYIDTFLQAFLFAINNPKKGSLDLLGIMNGHKKIFAPYRSEEGFTTLCRKSLLDDYLDENGNPKSLFEGVWCDQKGLTREQYVAAVEQYFDFCEPVIKKRAQIMLQRLKDVLGDDMVKAAEEEIMVLQVPDQFTQLKELPEDKKGQITYEKDSDEAICLIQIYPIDFGMTMPMDNIRPIIAGIHNCLADNQGLIEVANGQTKYEKHYAYSIVKTLHEPSGITYVLTMHLMKNGKALCLQAHFDERGTTGKRETTIYEYMRKEAIIKSLSEGWSRDPYDKDYKHGVLMNLSEKKEYDNYFPKHPLTEMRRLIAYIIENN